MQKKRTNKKSNKTSNGNSVGSFGSLLSESSQYQEIMGKFKSIVNSRVDKFYDDRGADGEMYAYAIAVNQVRNKAKESPAEEEPKPEEPMDKETKLKEMIQAALSKPLNEKKINQDKKKMIEGKGQEKAKKFVALLREKIFKTLNDEELKEFKQELALALDMKLNENYLNEDLDLGHQDNEPHMIKAELAQIGEYAMELYKMVDNFEEPQEVDFPAWWQSKITTAKNMISGAKHYLEFELKEPQIDAMVGIASEEDVINEYEDKTPKHKIVRQWVGPNSTFILATKPESEWDKKDHDLYNRILKMVQTTGKIPANLEEEMTPQKSQKIGMPFKDIAEAVLAKIKESKK